MPTPHISAEPGDFAEAILLPGDPLRAAGIAGSLLEDARQVNVVRNMLGFTGSYEGMPVSVMGTGMGIPSSAIYVTELIRDYGVERLVRVGTCGGVADEVGVGDVVAAIGASTDSTINRVRYNGWDFSATADYGLLSAAVAAAEELDATIHVGNIHSADLFYSPIPDVALIWRHMGILAVEMEAAGLYGIAAEERVRALAISTVSDHLVGDEHMSSSERETGFEAMAKIALEALLADAREMS
jgi:purine-nucleoside phosphorylase